MWGTAGKRTGNFFLYLDFLFCFNKKLIRREKRGGIILSSQSKKWNGNSWITSQSCVMMRLHHLQSTCTFCLQSCFQLLEQNHVLGRKWTSYFRNPHHLYKLCRNFQIKTSPNFCKIPSHTLKVKISKKFFSNQISLHDKWQVIHKLKTMITIIH